MISINSAHAANPSNYPNYPDVMLSEPKDFGCGAPATITYWPPSTPKAEEWQKSSCINNQTGERRRVREMNAHFIKGYAGPWSSDPGDVDGVNNDTYDLSVNDVETVKDPANHPNRYWDISDCRCAFGTEWDGVKCSAPGAPSGCSESSEVKTTSCSEFGGRLGDATSFRKINIDNECGNHGGWSDWNKSACVCPAGTHWDGTNCVGIQNGVCGSANDAELHTQPASGLCNVGTASAVTGTGPWNWTCSGVNGGSAASCSATRSTSGACGPANGVPSETKPTASLCANGAASTVTGAGPWNWTCLASHGGTNVNCSAPRKVNAACGPANGAGMISKPSYGLCSEGEPSAVDGNGPWTWTCQGSNTGASVSCSANKTCSTGTEIDTQACEAGFTGNRTRSRTTNAGGTCGSYSAWSAWDTSGCTATCTQGTETDSQACPAGYSGNQTRTRTTNTGGTCGSYGAWSGWDTSACTATCTQGTETDVQACDGGRTGNRSRTRTTNTGGTCGSYGAWSGWDESGCVSGPPPVTGACGTTVNTCTAGTPNDDAIVDGETEFRWRCDGQNGGANSGTCTAAKQCNPTYNTVKNLDILFLADNTGSMGPYIVSVASKANEILNAVSGSSDPRFAGTSLATGVAAYWGDPSEPYGENPYSLLKAINTDKASTVSAIGQWTPYGGGDLPEGNFYALSEAANAASGWRANSGKVIIWMGDAPGHETTVTAAQALDKLRNYGFRVIALYAENQWSSMNQNGQATYIANGTAGIASNISSASADQIAANVVNAIYSVSTSICESGGAGTPPPTPPGPPACVVDPAIRNRFECMDGYRDYEYDNCGNFLGMIDNSNCTGWYGGYDGGGGGS